MTNTPNSPGIEDYLFARARIGDRLTETQVRQCNAFFGPGYRFDKKRELEFQAGFPHCYNDNLRTRMSRED